MSNDWNKIMNNKHWGPTVGWDIQEERLYFVSYSGKEHILVKKHC